MTHVLKISKPYADAIAEGKKNFEVRLNDRGYNAGDEVSFIVKEGGLTVFNHPLCDKKFEIIYVHSGLGLKEEYVVFGIKELKSEEEEE